MLYMYLLLKNVLSKKDLKGKKRKFLLWRLCLSKSQHVIFDTFVFKIKSPNVIMGGKIISRFMLSFWAEIYTMYY